MFGRFRLATAAIALVALPPAQTRIDMPSENWSRNIDSEGRPSFTSPANWAATCKDWDDWEKPAPPFRIYGEIYYVGSCGITSLLLASSEGHVLIDSGTAVGAKLAMENIRLLGFDPKDIKHILISHEHFDHVGGLAYIQKFTGATIYTSAAASKVLKRGTTSASDPQSLSKHPAFAPVTGNIQMVEDGTVLRFSRREFRAISTPGHSPGAMSWEWTERQLDTAWTIVYADSLSPVSSAQYRFSDNSEYVEQYREGLQKLAEINAPSKPGRCLLLTPHPSASNMRLRIRDNLLTIGSVTACSDYATVIRSRLDARLAKEAAE